MGHHHGFGPDGLFRFRLSSSATHIIGNRSRKPVDIGESSQVDIGCTRHCRASKYQETHSITKVHVERDYII